MCILYMFSSVLYCFVLFFKRDLTTCIRPPILFQTNKENDGPVFERRPVVKRDKQPAAPFQAKASSNKGLSSTSNARYATATQKRVKTFIKDGRGAAATEKQPPRNQAILREQVGKDNKIIDEIPVPPSTAPSKLGVYKGKVVQSKIGSIWKTSTTGCLAETKTTTTTTTTKPSTIKAKVRNVKNDVQSTSAAPRQASQRPAQVARSAVTGSLPAIPSAKLVHSKITTTAPRNHKKATLNENSKPSIVRTEKVNKPASSNLSQYRLTIETAEERRCVFLEFGYYAPLSHN